MTPRLLNKKMAAYYCGVSHNTFELHIPVRPIRVGCRVLWDRKALDAWLDELSGLDEHKHKDTAYDERSRRLRE